MAQLKDTTINGDLIVTGDITAENSNSKLIGNGSSITDINASNITDGTLDADRLATSGVTAGTYGPVTSTGTITGVDGAYMEIPRITVDIYGRVTAASEVTYTAVDTGATSVEVIGTGNAVDSATYNATTRKLTLNKGCAALPKDGTQAMTGVLQADCGISVKGQLSYVNAAAVFSGGNGTEYAKIGQFSSSDTRLGFKGTSNTVVEAGSFNALSDARLKENFEPISIQKSILDLPTYMFDFINGAKNQIGCKAQDLQEICPEIVNEGSDGMLSIQESKIVYLLLEEVKKLRKEIDELRKE